MCRGVGATHASKSGRCRARFQSSRSPSSLTPFGPASPACPPFPLPLGRAPLPAVARLPVRHQLSPQNCSDVRCTEDSIAIKLFLFPLGFFGARHFAARPIDSKASGAQGGVSQGRAFGSKGDGSSLVSIELGMPLRAEGKLSRLPKLHADSHRCITMELAFASWSVTKLPAAAPSAEPPPLETIRFRVRLPS